VWGSERNGNEVEGGAAAGVKKAKEGGVVRVERRFHVVEIAPEVCPKRGTWKTG